MARDPIIPAALVVLAALVLLPACGGGGGGGGAPSGPSTFSLSGSVGGSVLSGVTLSLSGAATASATSAADGTFAFVGLAPGAYTITPSLAGFTFAPASRAVTVVAADIPLLDFTASAIPSISGAVTAPGGAPVAGATVVLSGAAQGTATTDAAGSYLFPGLADGSYSVVPSVPGSTCAPPLRSLTLAGASSAGNDFTAAPMPWTTRSFGNILRGVAWSGGTFVAVGDDLIATSPDATTWTPRAFQSGSDVVWTGSQFVATSYDRVLTSPAHGRSPRPRPRGAR